MFTLPHYKVCLPLLIASLLGVPCLGEPALAPSEVVAEGMGAVPGADRAAGRKAAINDAVRTAVEMKMGVHVKSSRVAETYLLKRDRIEARSEGIIEEYKVEDEKAIGPVYWVRIRAKFRQDTIKEQGLDQVQVGLLVKAAGLLEAEVQRGLSEAGLRIVPLPSSVNFGTGFADQVRAAKEASIDLLVLIGGAVEQKDDLGGLLLCRAISDVKVIKPYTEEVVVARCFRTLGQRRPDLESAAESALAKSGEEIVGYLVKEMLRKTAGLVESRLFLFGVEGRWQVDALKKELFMKKGIRNVELKTLAENMAVLLVQLEIREKESLGEYLSKSKEVRIEVKEQGPGWIQAQVKSEEK